MISSFNKIDNSLENESNKAINNSEINLIKKKKSSNDFTSLPKTPSL